MSKFIKPKKKYALNNSYFKNIRGLGLPENPQEVLEYFYEHNELPFRYEGDMDNWIYECYIEYQKRKGVYNSQFFTPPKTAERVAEIAFNYANEVTKFVDVCCGFGMLSKYLERKYYLIEGYDIFDGFEELFYENTNNNISFTASDFRNVKLNNYNDVVANPPYETPELTSFFEWLASQQDFIGHATLLIPKYFIEKERPKRTYEVLQKFDVIHREDMQEDFARTKTKAEIVVLRRKI